MNASRRLTGALLAVALLAGCGGTQSVAPRAALTNANILDGETHAHSWMLPNASSQGLLYVAEDEAVSVYSYPQAKLVGSVTLADGNFPAGDLCTDTSGNIFILAHTYGSGDNSVYEYAHGGTSPIAILDDSTFMPLACSVDRITGNLAVTNSYIMTSHFYGNLAVYKRGRKSAKIYTDSSVQLYKAPAYDNQGNLFITGYGHAPSLLFALAELPAGRKTFTNLVIDENAFQYPGGEVQWDGEYLAIATPQNDIEGHMLVQRVQVAGSMASIVKTINFKDWKYSIAPNFCIYDGQLISNAGGNHSRFKRVAFWAYPAGGKVISYFSAHQYVYGVAISVAPSGARIHK